MHYNNIMVLSFENEDKIAMIVYDPKNIIDSILS